GGDHLRGVAGPESGAAPVLHAAGRVHAAAAAGKAGSVPRRVREAGREGSAQLHRASGGEGRAAGEDRPRVRRHRSGHPAHQRYPQLQADQAGPDAGDPDGGRVARDARRFAAPPGPPPAAKRAPGTLYTVKAGDTLWTIAAKFSTTVDKLRRLNGLSGRRARALQVGQTIAVRES